MADPRTCSICGATFADDDASGTDRLVDHVADEHRDVLATLFAGRKEEEGPIKQQGLPIGGDAFAWIEYHGERERVERAATAVHASIEELRTELEEDEE